MIRFACPSCGKVCDAPPELAGVRRKCRRCGAIVAVPGGHVREVVKAYIPVALPASQPRATRPRQRTLLIMGISIVIVSSVLTLFASWLAY